MGGTQGYGLGMFDSTVEKIREKLNNGLESIKNLVR